MTLSACSIRGTSRATFHNESGKNIARADITADYNTVTLTDVEAGESREAVIRVWSDTSYEVRVIFADGETRYAKDGYLSGADTEDNITVTRDDIIIDVHHVGSQ